MIKNKMFQFELHPHIGEIRTKMLVYEKGGTIKHVEAPSINKVELFDLWKIDLVTMWNRVTYFITDCSTSCMSVLLSTTRFGISLCHYSFRSYKMCYSTLSHLWTFVSPWQPRRRRSLAEIAARWRCRLHIKNLTPHYNSEFCVSFHFCVDQEDGRRL